MARGLGFVVELNDLAPCGRGRLEEPGEGCYKALLVPSFSYEPRHCTKAHHIKPLRYILSPKLQLSNLVNPKSV